MKVERGASRLHGGAMIVRVNVLLAAVVYWIGVFSGWYARHPQGAPITNHNPDTFIHAALGIILPAMIADYWVKRRERPVPTQGGGG